MGPGACDWRPPGPCPRSKDGNRRGDAELDRPVTSKELYAIFDREWSLKAIEYHLYTLVKAKVAEVVYGPELHFRL